MAKKAIEALAEKKAAIYVRVSTVHQVDRVSLPVQLEELINYSKYALGITDFSVFEDAGYSAKNTDRPDYQRMMARIRTGEFSHLLVWKIDRISRNLLDFAAMYQELKELGVTFISKNEQFDTSSAMGEAMLKIILVFAELERNMTSERVTAIMLSRANSGSWNGGRVPYGFSYDKDTRGFSIVESEAKVIRYIYDRYDAIQSVTAIAKELNDRGVRSPSGKDWSPVSVHTILTNPFYVGTYRYNRRSEASGFKKRPESEHIYIQDHHPAIIDPERQAMVVARLHSRRRGQSRSTYQRKHVHIFAGLLRCGYCGSNMSATIDRERSGGWRPSVYLCSRHKYADDCPNKYVSDVTLGPFVLNFISNLIRASNSFGRSTSIETLEKKLLRGDMFSNVDHIERGGLEELYNHLRSGFDALDFNSPSVKSSESGSEIEEREILMSERRRLDRALNRLHSLFLYGDDAIEEKDYILERKQLTDKLDEVNARLEEIDRQEAATISMSDEEFMAKASYFVLSQQILDRRFVDYERFISQISPEIVKDFLNSVVQNFCIKDGLTTSILFKNGLEIKFSYKSK